MTLDIDRIRYDGLRRISRHYGVAGDLDDVIFELAERDAHYLKEAADAAAATVTGQTTFHHIPPGAESQTIHECLIVPGAGLSASAADRAEFSVRKRGADGSDLGRLFYTTTHTAHTGDWTAFQKVSIPKEAGTEDSDFVLTAEQSLTFEITKIGLGVVVPISVLKVFYS